MSRQRVDHAKAVEELHEALVDHLDQMVGSEDWLRYLETARKFHRYSPQNQMLLAIQGAQGSVAGYRNWQRIPAQGGGTCQVAKGQTGLKILAPMKATSKDVDAATGEEVTKHFLRGFRTVKVFHQGQLNTPPDIGEAVMPSLLTGDNRWEHVWTAVRDQLEADQFVVEEHTRTPIEQWNGLTNYTERKVLIADDLDAPQQIKTLLHEWAHVRLGHEQRREVPREILEVEAESVAYLLSQTIGLDSQVYSVPYIAGWSRGDTKLVEATAAQVLATTKLLVEDLERELGLKLTVDPVDHALPESETNVIALPGADTPTQRDAGPTTAEPLPTLAQSALFGPSRALSAIDQPDSSDFDFMRAVGAEFDNAQTEAFAQHIYRQDQAPTSATILAEAGRTATQTAKILTRFGIESERIREALSTPLTNGDGDVSPLYPLREATTAMATIEPGATATADGEPASEALRSEKLEDMRTMQRMLRSNPEVGLVAQLAQTFDIDPVDVVQVCEASEVSPDKTIAIAVALNNGDGSAAMNDLRSGWPEIRNGWESHAHPSMLASTSTAEPPTLVPDLREHDPILELFAEWDNMEIASAAPEPTMP